MTGFNDDGLLQEFLAESQEHLSAIEPDLLSLEKDGDQVDIEVVNRIFRAMHSIKGASGFFGFERVKRLSHVMESVLMQIRDGQRTPTPETIDALLAGVDKLNHMINNIHESETYDCDAEMACLDNIYRGEVACNDAPAMPVQTGETTSVADMLAAIPCAATYSLARPLPFQPVRAEVIGALSKGYNLYCLAVFAQEDLAEQGRLLTTVTTPLTAMGQLIEARHAGTCLPPADWACDTVPEAWMMAPILFLFGAKESEAEIASACNIPLGQVSLLDFMEVLERESYQEEAKFSAPAAPKAAAPATAVTQPVAEKTPEPPVEKPSDKNPAKPAAATTAVASDANETIRVKVDLLNKLMNLAGEMVLLRNQLTRHMEAHVSRVDGLAGIMQNLDLTTTDLQEHIMQTRMQPIGNIFGKFPRLVRDLSKQLNKKIELVTIGDDVELDKTLIESLSDPLTHLIRNCCDHAIETPEDRQAAGKSAQGTIQLKAFHQGGQINIAIIDDGKGIDGEAVCRKAVENGHLTEADAAKLSDKEKVNLIFLAGLSTAKVVSDVSGRGVGMDVVRTNIEKLGGQITIDSEKGYGTSILLRLPLTLAIIPSLIVKVQEHRFAIPQVNLEELMCVKAAEANQRIEQVGTATVLRLRGKLLPLVHLADVLGIERKFYDHKSGFTRPDRRNKVADQRKAAQLEQLLDDPQGHLKDLHDVDERRNEQASDIFVVVLKVGNNRYGLIVNDILDLEEIVVKPLSSYLKECKCYSGATIMGDGRVAMILDSAGVADKAKLSFAQAAEEKHLSDAVANYVAGLETFNVILFNNASDEQFAVPLSDVLRLEKIDNHDVHQLGHQEYINYAGKGMPIIRLESIMPVKPFEAQQEHSYLIIPKHGNMACGILAANICDITEVAVSLQEVFSGDYPAARGSAIVNKELTVFVNLLEAMRAAHIATDSTPALALR